MAISAIIARVHDALGHLDADCSMEDVPALCPELTWNQVFLAIDYLSRTGQVRVTLDPDRTYRVRATRAAAVEASRLTPMR